MAMIRKAVILAAGLGTRMLPATKAVPKEMLPIVDRPLIQYAVEEAVNAGIEEIVFVTADGKESITEHFTAGGRTAQILALDERTELLGVTEAPAKLAKFSAVRQAEPKGIADAVRCARAMLDGEPFALMFPDDLLLSDEPVIGQMMDAYPGAGSMIAVQSVRESEVHQYGIVSPAPGALADERCLRLTGIIEKPAADEAPSRLAVVGRYILSDSIFEHIDNIEPGKNGELQLTDALARQIACGESVFAYRYAGDRYDTGRPAGFIVASVAAALERPELAEAVHAQLEELMSRRLP